MYIFYISRLLMITLIFNGIISSIITIQSDFLDFENILFFSYSCSFFKDSELLSLQVYK
jgi:hypothetical protein